MTGRTPPILNTDKVVIGFRVEAGEEECNSEDVTDAEDIDEAIVVDIIDNHFSTAASMQIP